LFQVLALASVEVDIGNIPKGQMLTIKWRGKPVFIKHRTEAEIEASRAVPTASLRHPEDDQVRTKDTHPHILICLGVCTHLG
jgi:ubiquinol-cytochrome c reductase iron-sulfur subunit